MLGWRDGLKSLRIWGLGAIGGVCLGATAVWAALPAASRPSTTRPVAASATHPGAASQSTEDFQAYYQVRLAAIKSSDSEGLYSLALLCSNKDRPDLAAALCRQVLATWPSNAKAKTLLRASSLRLAASSRPAPTTRPAMTQPALTVAGVLTPEAINRIRLAEFRAEDMTDRPRVRIPKEVIQEFLEEVTKAQSMSDGDKNQFSRADNDDKLRWIIKKSDPQRHIDAIELGTEPRSMATFRQKVWPIISRGCAAPSCHGGEKAGHLRFVLPVSYGPAMSTNFYVLSQLEAGEGRLVDREQAEASLLLQFGLSPEQAQWKHPVATTPVFAGPNDPKYQVVLDWIRQLRSPCPDYKITDRMWQSFPTRPTAPRPE